MDFKNIQLRNDIKDFLDGNIDTTVNSVTVDFKVKETDEIIQVKVDRPDLLFGVTFILMPISDKGKYNGMSVINPINDEEVNIYFSDIEDVRVGIPAHNDDDYVFALNNGISLNQVIIPVNVNMGDDKPRDDKEWTTREIVMLVVKHWEEDKYLYIKYNKHNWKSLITGGIENGDRESAARMELEEESGFSNIKSIKELDFSMINVFYAAHKGVNRYVTVYGYLIELEDGEQAQIAEEEQEEHTLHWASKDELAEILADKFPDMLWVLKQSLNDTKAYTGNGKYINSDFLNDIENRQEAIERIKNKLN